MENRNIDYYEDHVILRYGTKRFRFETFVRRSKKSIFELVIVVPESITEVGYLAPLSSVESRSVVQALKKELSSGLNQGVALEFRNSFKHGLLEKISDAFAHYIKPKEEPREEINKRTFKGFELQSDNATAINKELGVTIKLEVKVSSSILYYTRQDGKKLTLSSGGDILKEILYSNTVVIEKPYQWDSNCEPLSISNDEMDEIKEHIKSAMELYDSLVFFKEVARTTQAEKDAYIQRQLDIINQRKKASNE